MAITKIHAVKATISGAVNYICNYNDILIVVRYIKQDATTDHLSGDFLSFLKKQI